MKFKFPYKNHSAEALIRRCGYGKITDPVTGQISYSRKLSGGLYPRFHVYIQEFEKYFEVSLHLDQKQLRTEHFKAHAGEYDGSVVENEARRITAVIQEIYSDK
jgi:hypothetical protein